ncbi:hypothetical protein Afil01_23410 [Actinorhabdospora filicis]|uniref:Uncharacterized protein n=1 Tax=Actinorhabdospora filicis TaxID=1785913 RepID=A0A9W6SI46_9ACTN|nr:hypothetical protein [Actinorhabdospora filicis]GLZ77534.1 hypothetical protein Afil01_23410 [Actinorhabdospora filicis]
MNEDERTLLLTAITEDAKAPLDVIERLGDERTYELMSAAMAEAIDRSVTRGVAPGRVREYVEELLERFPAAREELSPAVLEAVIRGGLGEEGLLEPVTFDEVLAASRLLTYDLMARQDLDAAGREDFVRTVVELADEVG